jgi:hypothetical protein
VDATAGTRQVMAFADSVSALNVAEMTGKIANRKTPPLEISKLSDGGVYNLFDNFLFLDYLLRNALIADKNFRKINAFRQMENVYHT